MGLNVNLAKMLGLDNWRSCPRCKHSVNGHLDDYDIECGNPNPAPGEWKLNFYCAECEYEWEEGFSIIGLTKRTVRMRDMPVTHRLKCWPTQFKAVQDRVKTFEVRVNDRGYEVGDTLLLMEWEPKTEEYTGQTEQRVVTYKVEGLFGLPPDVCVMSIK